MQTRPTICLSHQPHNEERTTIASIPPEILITIFEIAHSDTKVKQLLSLLEHNGRDKSSPVYDVVMPYFKAPYLFPYAPAGVCRLWKDILRVKKEFWTTVVLFIDAQPTLPADASWILDASGYLPIDVMLLSRAEPVVVIEDQGIERKRVQDLMEVVSLQRNMARCKTFFIDTSFTPYLPSFPHDFRHRSALMTELTLECTHDDLKGPRDDSSDINLSSPNIDDADSRLTKVTLDGVNFQKAVARGSALDFKGIQHLTVAHYAGGMRKQSPSVEDTVDFLESLPDRLQTLKLVDISLPRANFDIWTESQQTLNCRSLCLRDMNQRTMKDIFERCHFNNLHYLEFHGCWVETHKFPTRAPMLTLRGLREGAAIEEILEFWEGVHLVLLDCPVLDDDLLDTLASPIICSAEYADPGDPICCPNMVELQLCICPNFSMASLKRVVEFRNKSIDYTNPQWRQVAHPSPVIRKLMATGSCMDRLSEEDEAWFRARVPEFSWIGMPY